MCNKKTFYFIVTLCLILICIPVNAKSVNVAESTRKKLGYYVTSKTITKIEATKEIRIQGKPNTTYYLLMGTNRNSLKSKRTIKTNSKGKNTVKIPYGVTYRGTGTGLQWYVKNKKKLTYDELIYVAEHSFILSNKTEAVKVAKKEAEKEAEKNYKIDIKNHKMYFAISKSRNGKPVQVKLVNPFSKVYLNIH